MPRILVLLALLLATPAAANPLGLDLPAPEGFCAVAADSPPYQRLTAALAPEDLLLAYFVPCDETARMASGQALVDRRTVVVQTPARGGDLSPLPLAREAFLTRVVAALEAGNGLDEAVNQRLARLRELGEARLSQNFEVRPTATAVYIHSVAEMAGQEIASVALTTLLAGQPLSAAFTAHHDTPAVFERLEADARAYLKTLTVANPGRGSARDTDPTWPLALAGVGVLLLGLGAGAIWWRWRQAQRQDGA